MDPRMIVFRSDLAQINNIIDYLNQYMLEHTDAVESNSYGIRDAMIEIAQIIYQYAGVEVGRERIPLPRIKPSSLNVNPDSEPAMYDAMLAGIQAQLISLKTSFFSNNGKFKQMVMKFLTDNQDYIRRELSDRLQLRLDNIELARNNLMMNNADNAPIFTMSSDILRLLSTYLEPQDIVALRRTTVRFSIFDQDGVWQRHVLRAFAPEPAVLADMLREHGSYKKVFIELSKMPQGVCYLAYRGAPAQIYDCIEMLNQHLFADAEKIKNYSLLSDNLGSTKSFLLSKTIRGDARLIIELNIPAFKATEMLTVDLIDMRRYVTGIGMDSFYDHEIKMIPVKYSVEDSCFYRMDNELQDAMRNNRTAYV